MNSHITVSAPSLGLPENDLIGIAVRAHKPHASPKSTGVWDRRDEPAWHDTNVLLRACREIGSSNYTRIQQAVSIQSRVFVDLAVFRNYFAHRNSDTRRAAMRLGPNHGIGATAGPSSILLARPLTASRPVLLDWIDDVSLVVAYLCE